jgi:hypothetical protein
MDQRTVGLLFTELQQYATPLLLAALVLVLLEVVLLRLGLIAERRRRSPSSRRVSVKTLLRSSKADREIDLEEFVAVMRVSPSRYMLITLGWSGLAALVCMFYLGSWGLAIATSMSLLMWRQGRSRGKMARAREESLAEELIPTAESIVESLEGGQTLIMAIREQARTMPHTTFERSIRRAAFPSGPLEDVLRGEERRAQQDVVKEFFEIMADGATTVRDTHLTTEILETFITLNARRQDAWTRAIQKTSQARGTRTLLLTIVPLIMAASTLQTGPAEMLHSSGGNLIIVIVFGLLLVAVTITNGILNSVTKV